MSDAMNIVAEKFNEVPSESVPRADTTAKLIPLAANGASDKGAGRLLFIDGLRGVAALLVMLFHFYTDKVSPLYSYLHGTVPRVLEWLILQGYVGVEIFFVLSGFVIAYSLRNEECSPKFALNFMIRRSIRLDPPYWTILAITVGYRCILWHQYTGLILRTIGWHNILRNMFYLADPNHRPIYVGVAWTLVLEIRFYLSFIAMLVAAYTAKQLIGPRSGIWAFVILFVPLTIVSIFWRYGTGELTFLGAWYMFAMGVTLALAITGKIRERWMWILVAGAACGELWELDLRASIAAATVLMIYAASRTGNMSNWLAWRWTQNLGKISYSLYLCHVVVGLAVIDIFLSYGDGSNFLGIAALIAASAVSIIAAQVLQAAVEGPCIKLAKWLKPAKRTSLKPRKIVEQAPIDIPQPEGQLVTA